MAGIPIVSDIIKVGTTVFGLSRSAFSILEDALSGEMDRDTIRKFAKLFADAGNLSDEVMRLQMVAAVLAASIATGQITNSLQSGTLSGLVNTQVGQAIARGYGFLNAMRARVEKELERIKGNLDWRAITTAYQHLRIAHNIGLQFSPRYRAAVEDFYRNTADLSRQVFGPANSLFHGLALLQLVINDTARINGRTAADGQAEFLTSATNASRRVADRSRTYARDGSKFWGDFQLRHIQPQIDAQYQGQIQRDSLIGRIDTTASAARDRVRSVSDSFTAYTQHLDPFLSDDNIKDMEAIQRDFNRDIRRPVERFQGFMAETFPNIVEVTEQLAEDDKVLAGGVLESLERTDYPDSLTEPQKASQGLRFNSIMDSAFVRGDGAPRTIEHDMAVVRSIYDILEAR